MSTRLRSRRFAVVIGTLGAAGALIVGATPEGRAIALAALAGVGLLFVARGWARRLLGVVLCGLGVALGATASAAAVGIATGAGTTAAGVLAVIGGGGWPTSTSRYDRLEAENPWLALDRGVDPTIDEAPPRAADPNSPA